MRRQPADSIRARGMHIPQPKAGYMAAIFTCPVNTKETALQPGERPYMARRIGLKQPDTCILTYFRYVSCSMFVHPFPRELNNVAQTRGSRSAGLLHTRRIGAHSSHRRTTRYSPALYVST